MTKKKAKHAVAQPSNPVLESYEQQHLPEVDVERLHAAVYREKTDPKEGNQPVPIWLILSSFALLMWGGWYLGSFSGKFDGNRYEGPAAFRNGGNREIASVAPKIDPMQMGKRFYNNCSACHRVDGSGGAGKFPPLDGSEWVLGREDNLARILLQGLIGPIDVKGQTYDGNMPKWSHLDNRSLASVLTYIRGSWSNNASPVSTELVAAVRQATAGRAEPWTAEQLSAAPVIKVDVVSDGDDDPASSNSGQNKQE